MALQQQRLAAGDAGPDHEDGLGQRGFDQPEDRQRTRGREFGPVRSR